MAEKAHFTVFRNPHTKPSFKDALLLAAGMVFLLFGVVFAVLKMSTGEKDISVMGPALFIAAGEILLFVTFVFTRGAVNFFCGIYSVILGIAMLIIKTQLPDFEIIKAWPLAVVVSGLSLSFTGIYKTKRILTFYDFPAAGLTGIGIIFLLFSMKIFKSEFKTVLQKFWPMILIFFGLVLVLVFLIQQSNKKNFPYLRDENEDGERL